MKIAILGGGFTGMTAAYYAALAGHEVALFEKDKVLGGLAIGFKEKGWNWYVERAIHHLFKNDYDIQRFAKEIEFNKIFFQRPLTASLYGSEDDYKIIPLDSPVDLLRFPYLSLPQNLRAGLVLAFLKASPFLRLYEKQTAQEFLTKTMGEQAWQVLWEELFRKKFGKYAGNILASFIWARIKKRSASLGYIEGGFQSFINHIVEELYKQKVEVKTECGVKNISYARDVFRVDYVDLGGGGVEEHARFDAVISTLPTPILARVVDDLLPTSYTSRLEKIQYQHAISLILETKEPFLKKEYWLNMCAKDNAIMGLFQHTNFVDKKHYGGHHILYAGNYVVYEDPRVKMTNEEILKFYLPHLKKINPAFEASKILRYYVFKGPFAQPIFDENFLRNKPDFVTPVKNFFIANLDMTYPYDRGTNYAVKLGRDVVHLL